MVELYLTICVFDPITILFINSSRILLAVVVHFTALANSGGLDVLFRDKNRLEGWTRIL